MSAAGRFAFAQRRVHDIEQRRSFDKAYVHESAHAIIGHFYGLDVEMLHVALPTGGPDPNGVCRFVRAPMETLALADEMVISEAGGVADEKFSGRDTTGYADVFSMAGPAVRHCRGDTAAASEMMLTARRRAAELVDKYWDAIRALAHALADHGGVMTQGQIAPYLANVPQRTTALPPRRAPARSRPAEIVPTRVRGTFVSVDVPGADGRMYKSYVPASSV